MELFSVTLAGFRRFKQSTTVRTNGKVIAILGPNEAGKTSFLRALAHMNDTEPFGAGDVTRGGVEEDLSVQTRYLLSEEEVSRAGLTSPRWMTLRKEFGGNRYCGFVPPAPPRDISHRPPVIKALSDALKSSSMLEFLEQNDDGIQDYITKTIAKYGDASSDLSTTFIKDLSTVLNHIDNAILISDDTQLNRLRDLLSVAIELEAQKNPQRVAIDALIDDVPKALIFGEEERNLRSSYQISDLREYVPQALEGLLDLSGLNLTDLFDAIDRSSSVDIETYELRANERLKERFAESWGQSKISFLFRISMTSIEIRILNESKVFSDLSERSDGVRQFIALQSFIMREHGNKPILLIDEAEQRLHYDAQADLMQMLAKQNLASKAIITTHSAGCLPEDLGLGVRLASISKTDPTQTSFVNKFWSEEGLGFSPLLFGMGAATLAFFPTRRAVMVEGAADMLLYPTLFREALGAEYLDFQFVPGLSESGELTLPLMADMGRHIAYLTDGDDGGLKIQGKLLKAGIDSSRIITTHNSSKTAVELEDFIDPGLLLVAANALIERYHSGRPAITLDDLKETTRMAALEAAYLENTGVEIPKVELAYELIDMSDRDPEAKMLDSKRSPAFVKIAQSVKEAIFPLEG